MTSGPDDAPRHQDSSFADVVNGFGIYSGRTHRRHWGHEQETDNPEQARPALDSPPFGVPNAAERPLSDHPAAHGPGVLLEPVVPGTASAVRPYAWTKGRTKSGFDLAIETLVSTSPQGRSQLALLQIEHRSVAELCDEPRSVAEIAAMLSLPLGVARVLLGDMAGLGVVTVHQSVSSAGNLPDLTLMERVLSGLRRL